MDGWRGGVVRLLRLLHEGGTGGTGLMTRGIWRCFWLFRNEHEKWSIACRMFYPFLGITPCGVFFGNICTRVCVYDYAVLPLRFLNSSIHPAALSLGTTLILTSPSTTSVFPLPRIFPKLIFFPTFIKPPAVVSMYASTCSMVYSCFSSHGKGKM